ncbi:MAG: hypothetical protein P4L87_15475 [Formivibrio sp.]|nr:hypothetical protein [Formivibrio sp.]
MKKTSWAIVVVGVCCFFLRLSTYVMPEFLCILLSTLLLVALVVLLVVSSRVGFIRWRKSSHLWPAPSLVCLAFILCAYYFAPSMGRYISDWKFGRHLAEYSRVVNGLKNGTISCATPCNANVEVIEVTSRPAHIRDIWGARCDDNGVIVLFRVDTDVPLLHEGYFFKDYGVTSNCNIRSVSPEVSWPHVPYIRHIAGQWYRFSDQPGL